MWSNSNTRRFPCCLSTATQDTFVPYDMLDQNYDACASKVKQKLTIHGATHAKSAQVDPELYWNTVDDFLDKNF